MKKNQNLLLVVFIFVAACGTSYSMAESSKSRVMNPNIPAADVKTLVDGNNAFALDIYRSLHSESGNLILSPYSMSLALAMPYAGAHGETESQMANVLHFTQSQAVLHPAFNALDLALAEVPTDLRKNQDPLTLSIANAVWAEQTYPFQQDYLDTIALNYGAGVFLADFKNQFGSARKDINQWVGDETKNKIKNPLSEGAVNADTRMVLVNAIYFKADWDSPFNASSTEKAPFYLLDDSQVTVQMMRDHFSVPYYAGNGYQAVELPYAGQTTAMDIILPDAGNYDAFESSFGLETYTEMINGFQYAGVNMGLPQFTFTKDFNLTNILTTMGMPDAFDINAADFSGMTGAKDMYIGNVIHKAFVAVDEKGTEAAATTISIVIGGAAPIDVNFTADHPFIFIIRDTVNGQILFIGRVLNPLEE